MYLIIITAHKQCPITLFWIWNIGPSTILGVPPLALVVDTCTSANLTIKHKQQKNNLFSVILFSTVCCYHTYAPLATLQTSQFKNPWPSLESNKTVVMKPQHSCTFLNYTTLVYVWRNRMVGSKDSFCWNHSTVGLTSTP